MNKIKSTPGEIIFDTLNILLMIFVCFVTIYPFWYVLILSLNEGRDAALGGIWFWPRVFTLQNYTYVLGNRALKSAYMITILRTVIGSLLAVIITGFAAYGLSKKHLPGRSGIITFFMIPMFIGGTVVSTYIIIANLGLLNNFLVYIIPGAFSFFNMIIMRTFIYGLPASLEESAKLDGASYFTIFFRIIMPLCMPVVATLLLFNGVGHWLDFYTNLMYVSKRELMTAQYLLYQVVRANQLSQMTEQSAERAGNVDALRQRIVTPQSIKMSTLMIVTLPILCLYPFLQKYFIKGVLIGAIKE